ncbi:MAG: TIGR02302 family protein [Rhizobiaceae bacterium]
MSGLARVRTLTGLSMLFERLWPLLLPSIITASVLITLSWAGLFRALPEMTRFGFLAALGVAFVASLWPLRAFRFPSSAQITARIESGNTLMHQPIAAQDDRPAGSPDDFASALWREHQSRMAAKLGNLATRSPSPKTHEQDRFALRALPALGLAVAFAYSFGSGGGRISDIWTGPAAAAPVPPRIDAWVTPPRYTGKAPIFLTSAQDTGPATITVPENSELTVRIGVTPKSGDTGPAFALLQDGNPVAAPAKSDAPVSGAVLKGILGSGGTITLSQDGQQAAAWNFTIVEDKPPTITFAADPVAALNGAVTLAYKIVDDYGAVKGFAAFKPTGAKPDARPLYTLDDQVLTLPRKASPGGAAKITKDWTEHPLAGETFEISLKTEDGAGQAAVSEVKTFKLPEYSFAHPLAKAMAEDRRLLSRNANDKPLVLDYLDAILMRPEETLQNKSHFLGVKTARIRLAYANTDDELRDVADYLWELAKEIDKNALSDAERRLKIAQDKLSEALERGASDQEIEKLMSELRQAMNEFLKELAEQADKNPQSAQNDQNGQELSQSDLEKMLDKLEELAKQGSKDQARELLNQLRDMMNNMQAQRGKSGKGGEGQSEMEGQLNELGKLLRDQKKLMDETYRQGRQPGEQGDGGEQPGGQQQGQGQDGQGQQGQGEQGQNPGEGSGQGMGDLARRQGELGQRLNRMMDGLRGLGMEPGEELGDAGRAMGRAGRNLGEGDTNEATGDQADALEALRKGAESLMDQMRQAMGEQGGGQQPGGRRGPNDRDPLGRPRATEGPDFGQSTKVPDEIDIQRAREILEAIRKRLGDALSPELERSYLERLLKFE